MRTDGWDEETVVKLTSKDDYEEIHYGQGVRSTFYQADFFIRNDGQNEERLITTIKRHLGVIFGEPVHTPTKDESAMHSAYAAASRSACMSRQVGAAIISNAGELIGIGWNDVPKYRGGLYSEDDLTSDHRCFKWGSKICHNDNRKDRLFDDIYDKLSIDGLLKDDTDVDSIKKSLRITDVNQLIEYSRAIHAEMSALLDVIRNAKAGIIGSTLYCTTFPCHLCARHLIGAGVERVVYIEPYPKSLALQLHKDATSSNEQDSGSKLLLQQYEGVSPRNVFKLYKQQDIKRKDKGKLIVYNRGQAKPLGSVSVDDFSTHEKRVLEKLKSIESA